MAVNINDGILSYLDAEASHHNGHGSKKFIELVKKLGVQDGFVRVTKKNMAEYFGVSRQTMDDYINRYNKEHVKNNENQTV